MKKQKLFLFIIFAITALLASCDGGTSPVVEVTHLPRQPVESPPATPEVVEVTSIVYQTVVVTQIDQKVITTTPIPTILKATLSPQNIESTYFDGAIVVTQYYTLLSQGLFEDAYQLLNPSRPNPQSLDDFLIGAKKVFQTVEILKVQPYYLWSKQQEDTSLKDTDDQIRYYVEVYVDGEDGWASIPYGIWNPIVTVIRENDRWFIYAFDSITSR